MGVKKVGILFIVSMLILTITSAHVPQTDGDHDSLGSAKHVHDPTKSWVVYSELDADGGVNYYEMDMDKGERLKVGIILPKDDFVPSMVIMGPGIDENDTIPGFIETPDGTGKKLLEGEIDEMEYEPFTPSAYHNVLSYEMDIQDPGEYNVVVFNEDSGGKYGLVVGYEERYGPLEWIRVPIDVINIHIWEGQPLWLIFYPMLTVLGTGSAYLYYRKEYKEENGLNNIRKLGLYTTGLLYIGSGTMLLNQMLIACLKAPPGAGVALTLSFVALPIFFGSLLIKRSFEPDIKRVQKVKIIFYGLLGFFIWAGLIIGPIIAILSPLIPDEFTLSLS